MTQKETEEGSFCVCTNVSGSTCHGSRSLLKHAVGDSFFIGLQKVNEASLARCSEEAQGHVLLYRKRDWSDWGSSELRDLHQILIAQVSLFKMPFNHPKGGGPLVGFHCFGGAGSYEAVSKALVLAAGGQVVDFAAGPYKAKIGRRFSVSLWEAGSLPCYLMAA